MKGCEREKKREKTREEKPHCCSISDSKNKRKFQNNTEGYFLLWEMGGKYEVKIRSSYTYNCIQKKD